MLAGEVAKLPRRDPGHELLVVRAPHWPHHVGELGGDPGEDGLGLGEECDGVGHAADLFGRLVKVSRKNVEVDASAAEVASLERAKFVRRNEQPLLSGCGSNDGQSARVAARVASDNEDRRAHRLESAEPRRLTLRRLIQPLLADFIIGGSSRS